MKYYLLTWALLMLAVALYALGATGGTFVLLLAAAVELLFWVRVLRRPRHPASTIAAEER